MTPFADTRRCRYFISLMPFKLIRSDPTEGLRTPQAGTQLPLPAEVPLKLQP